MSTVGVRDSALGEGAGPERRTDAFGGQGDAMYLQGKPLQTRHKACDLRRRSAGAVESAGVAALWDGAVTASFHAHTPRLDVDDVALLFKIAVLIVIAEGTPAILTVDCSVRSAGDARVARAHDNGAAVAEVGHQGEILAVVAGCDARGDAQIAPHPDQGPDELDAVEVEGVPDGPERAGHDVAAPERLVGGQERGG